MFYGTGNFQFKFYSGLFLTNKAVSITSLQADSGSGYQNLTAGNSISVYYATGGRKTIRFIVNYSNGAQVHTYAQIHIEDNGASSSSSAARQGQPVPWDDRFTIQDTHYGFQGYDETERKYNYGTWAVYYHRTSPGGPIERVIRKPVIILDGFDPLDTRDQRVIYGNYLAYGQNNKLGDELRDLGYDIIILNFPKDNLERLITITTPFGNFSFPVYRDGGADYIQRNAFLLVTLIEEINRILTVNQSSEKLVVVGPSMGGLISRYTLKWMENNGKNTNTRLWISFDSPHKGANIAIGDQHFLNFFAEKANNKGAKDARDRQINSPAAKQMLLHHYLADLASGTRNNLPAGAPNFRNR